MLKNENKSKDQPRDEFIELRQRITELEKSKNQLKRVEETLKASEAELSAIFNNAPVVMVLLDKERRVQRVNRTTVDFIGYPAEKMVGLRGGEALRCIHSLDDPRGCGFGPSCKTCKVRNLVLDTFQTGKSYHRVEANLTITHGEKQEEINLLVSTTPLISSGKQMVLTSFEDITDLKRAEEALRESEEKFRSLAEHSPNMIFIDKKGRVVYANDRCEEIMGYTKDEFYSPNFDFLTLIAPESVEKVKSIFSKHMRGEEVEPFDYTIITKDGKRLEAILTTKLINYEGEKAILGTITDITKRKRAEQELEERLRYEEGISYCSRELVETTNLDKSLSRVVKKLLEVAGVSRVYIFENFENPVDGTCVSQRYEAVANEALSRIDDLVLHHLPYKHASKNLLDTLKLGKEFKGPIRELPLEDRKVLEPKDILSLLILPINVARQLWGFIGFDDCLTERVWREEDVQLLKTAASMIGDAIEHKQAEDALRESEEKFRSMFEYATEFIFILDTRGMIIETNPATVSGLGYTESELVGQRLGDFFTPTYQKLFEEHFTTLWEKGGHRHEVEFIRKDGVIITMDHSAFAIRSDQGEITSFVVFHRDITERKLAEEALKQRAEELERSKAELEQSLQELLERVEREHEVLVTLPVPALDIEEKGAIFLYPLDIEKEAYNLFLSRNNSKRPALAITRTFPPRFHKKLGRELETVWLTSNRVPDMVCVDPSDTMNLILVLTEFFKRAPKGVALFEGVEYIISIAGFKRFLQIVQLLNDKIAITEGAIYMILDLEVLEEKERRYILRECLSPLNGFGNGEVVKVSKNEG